MNFLFNQQFTKFFIYIKIELIKKNKDKYTISKIKLKYKIKRIKKNIIYNKKKINFY